jgi:DNA-binding NarL/FixJ family response regulator
MKFLLIDDHELFQLGFKALCQTLVKETQIICCETSKQAKKIINKNNDFDLIFIDLDLPDDSGLSLLDFCQTNNIKSKQVILSANSDPTVIQTAFSMGAKGYISKMSDSDTTIKAIELILSGEMYVPKEIISMIAISSPTLTPKQLQILNYLANGDNNKDIADKVHLSLGTVRNYVSKILEVLGAESRSQAIVIAKNKGLV